MFHLTRQVRFAVNVAADEQLENAPTNSYGGYPSLTGLGYFFALDVTVRAEKLDRDRDYLLNIKDIDDAVRREIVPMVSLSIAAGQFTGGGLVVREIFNALQSRLVARFVDVALESTTLHLSPLLWVACFQREHPMVRLSQKFEFSASHRLHNPKLSDDENRQAFGKCNNPHGHGHNYEVQVTLVGKPDGNGLIINVPSFERIVADTVITRFDHRNLNTEVPEFRELNPTVENIAKVIHDLLKPAFSNHARLHGVTVWETPKTWSEYSET